MEKSQVLPLLQKLRQESPKRKFSQTIDLVINLKNLDIKKAEEKVDVFLTLPKTRGKRVKVCALVEDGTKPGACEKTIEKQYFKQLKKSEIKKIASEHEFFIAHVKLMPEIASTFGRFLGSRGKMPNPKAGCVVPPNLPLEAVHKKLQSTVRLVTKNDASLKCCIGTETMSDDDLAENLTHVFNTLQSSLPQGNNNIKSVLVKMTMGPVVKVA